MVDRELEVGGKFGLPAVGGFALELEGRFRQTWTKRGHALTDVAAATAGIDAAELGTRLEGSEAARDVYWLALNRAVEVRDLDYVAALGRLVGQALDVARIDDVAFLTSELTRLEPIHLRVLVRTFRFVAGGQHTDDPLAAEVASFREDEFAVNDEHDLARALGVGVLAADRALSRMVTDGYVVRGPLPKSTTGSAILPTAWGGEALLMLFPNITEAHLGGDIYARRP